MCTASATRREGIHRSRSKRALPDVSALLRVAPRSPCHARPAPSKRDERRNRQVGSYCGRENFPTDLQGIALRGIEPYGIKVQGIGPQGASRNESILRNRPEKSSRRQTHCMRMRNSSANPSTRLMATIRTPSPVKSFSTKTCRGFSASGMVSVMAVISARQSRADAACRVSQRLRLR
jgi:hypothetical protein